MNRCSEDGMNFSTEVNEVVRLLSQDMAVGVPLSNLHIAMKPR